MPPDHVDYLARLNVNDYARGAFAAKADSGERYKPDGGVYAGSGSPWANPTSRDQKLFAPRARLVVVPVGRVFGRWVSSALLTQDWRSAARGAWWSTDAGVEQIVAETLAARGSRGDSGIAARVFSNVGYFDQQGLATSDMRCVVACRITKPVKVLLGVGRPTTSNRPAPGGGRDKQLWDSRELQAVMYTSRDQIFHGEEFLHPVFFGSSSDFTDWWIRQNPFRQRRAGALAGQ